MRKLISILIRKSIRFLDKCRNKIVIAYLRLKYPNCKITFSSYIESGCKIKCTANSTLKINNTYISQGTYIVADHGGYIEINDAFIGRNCVIVARQKITVASNCLIAEMVVIRDQNHNFGKSDYKIAEQGFSTSAIEIRENVWLAAKSTIIAGSVIGENTVVGANAVVCNAIDPNSVYLGVPAKKVRSF